MLTPQINAVEWKNGTCQLLDQTRLPQTETYLNCTRYVEVVDAIKRLAVRGAPAIGIAGAYAVVLAAKETLRTDGDLNYFSQALDSVVNARPTAVNLKWAVDRMRRHCEGAALTSGLVERLEMEAKKIHAEDIEANRRMASFGAELLERPVGALTYCNTGDLATGGIGTAFGVLRQGYLSGKITRVFPCETRPVLQGLRLTVYELQRNQIPFTVICDNMAALVMRSRQVGAVFVGSDRVAANGDAANKVGTYSLAVLAKAHQIPFYIVAPTSTFDMSLASGSQIPIEQRASEEILGLLGRGFRETPAMNPSFDVTPHELISAIVCERGIIHSPNTERVRAVLAGTCV